MYDRTAIMKAAWARYRRAYGSSPIFYRERFREALRLCWATAKIRAADAKHRASVAARAALPTSGGAIALAPRDLSPMEAALDAVKYLPAHISAAHAEAQIRASFGAGTHA